MSDTLETINNSSIDYILECLKTGQNLDLLTARLLDLTIDDVLKKDENDITYLEYMCKRKINISNFQLQVNIINNKESLFICVKNNYIDWMISSPSEDLLFEKDENGKNVFEYLFENDMRIPFSFCNIIENHLEIIDMAGKYNKYDQISNINNKLFSKLFTLENGQFLIDKYIKDNNFVKAFDYKFGCVDFNVLLNYCNAKNNYDLFERCSEEQLLTDLGNGKIGLDIVFEKYILNHEKIGRLSYKLRWLDINVLLNACNKYNYYDVLIDCNLKQLLKVLDSGKTLFEELYEKNILKTNNISNFSYDVKNIDINAILNLCNSINNYDLLKYCNEEQYLTTLDNGKTVLEFILDKNINPLFDGYDFKDKKTLDILIKYNKIDLLFNADMELLNNKYDDKNTYLDLMVAELKNGNYVNLEQMSIVNKNKSSEVIANNLITFAQKGIIGFIPIIDNELLLHKLASDQKTVLEHLLEKDKDLTMKEIYSRCRHKSDPDIAVILRGYGINDTTMELKDDDKNFALDLIKSYNDNYVEGYDGKHDDLLNELKDLFYNYGVSDKSLIDALIKGYQQFLVENEEIALQEVKQLIEIKNNNYDKFTYRKIKDTGYFDGKGVCVEDDMIGTLNHETSHALHCYLADKYVPDNYFDAIERVRNNPEFILKVKEFMTQYSQIKNKLKESISKSDIDNYYEEKYAGEKVVELAIFLRSSKEEQKKKFINDYPEQVLDTILAGSYSVDEFIAQRKEIEKQEVLDVTLRNEIGPLLAIGDIIDAISLGRFKNSVILDANGEFIDTKGTYGHGIGYYSKEFHGFDEMIAEYGEILKAKNGEEMLLYLRSLVGDELVDLMEDCYLNKMLKSNVYIENIEEVKGRER